VNGPGVGARVYLAYGATDMRNGITGVVRAGNRNRGNIDGEVHRGSAVIEWRPRVQLHDVSSGSIWPKTSGLKLQLLDQTVVSPHDALVYTLGMAATCSTALSVNPKPKGVLREQSQCLGSAPVCEQPTVTSCFGLVSI
jgi:hypothetical protein